MIYGCKKCRKEVKPINGELSCCGVTEPVGRVQYASRKLSESLHNTLFDPSVETWNDDTEEFDIEGTPNQ